MQGAVTFVFDSATAIVAMSSSSIVDVMTELLNVMCDVLIQLDESLILATSSSKLNALLLRVPKAGEGIFHVAAQHHVSGRFVEFTKRSDLVTQSCYEV